MWHSKQSDNIIGKHRSIIERIQIGRKVGSICCKTGVLKLAVSRSEKLTLGDALKDLGWFPLLFSVVVGGPSILSILQQVFVDQLLIAGLQWIVDGYNGIMAVLAAFVEPPIGYIVEWINQQLSWNLELRPIWRPLFTLSMVFVVVATRWFVRIQGLKYAIKYSAVMTFGTLLGTLGPALVPVRGFVSAGMTAAVPILAIFVASTLADNTPRYSWEELKYILGNGAKIALCGFIAASIFYVIPYTRAASGVLVFGGALAFLGLYAIFQGSKVADILILRAGLQVCGGFVTAGIILVANAAIVMFGPEA
jgi:hypothetical protein